MNKREVQDEILILKSLCVDLLTKNPFNTSGDFPVWLAQAKTGLINKIHEIIHKLEQQHESTNTPVRRKRNSTSKKRKIVNKIVRRKKSGK